MWSKVKDSSMDKERNSPIQLKTNRNGGFEVATIPVVYIAGKIQQDLRRYDLLDFTLTHSQKRRPKEAPLRKFTFNKQNYIYSGPYIIACHPQCQESLKPAEIGIEKPENYYLRALQGIQKADYVIVWLEGNDQYDAMTEIGYAFALKKKIFIACEPKVQKNYSFAFKMSKRDRLIENRKKGLQWLFEQISKEQKNRVETVQLKPVQARQEQVEPVQIRQEQVEAENQKINQLVCHGCIGRRHLCLLQKENIRHCFRCGQRDFYMSNCPICPRKKVKV